MSKPTTVRELIEALEKLDPETHVCVQHAASGIADLELTTAVRTYHRNVDVPSMGAGFSGRHALGRGGEDNCIALGLWD
jgi:hypothetical protein